MFADHDFNPVHEDKPGDGDLIQDLDLSTLWAAAANGDQTIHTAVRTAMLEPLHDPSQIIYRQDVLADCLARPDVIAALYALARDTMHQEHEIRRAGFFSHSSEALLNRSVAALQLFVTALKRLRVIADQHAEGFSSAGFRRFFDGLLVELDDQYFVEITERLRVLQFSDGLLASASLGSHSQGTDYRLRVPRKQNRSRLIPRRIPVKRPAYSRTMPRDDDGAHQDLAGLRDRILATAAGSLAQAAEHILEFFTAVRTELAFYLGCLQLHDHFTARNLPVCRPDPRLAETRLTARGLYDPCLGLRSPYPVQGNDLNADGKPLIIITGANQGGKSTFLRSLGIAQLMMQAGLPVAADSFSASTVAAVYTHYAREEDATMTSGKFDEELDRMSQIAHRIPPHSLLLCNESFAATNEREGADIATDVLFAFRRFGITVAFVTHLYELARRFEEQDSGTTLFLRADRSEDNRPSYRLHAAPPQPSSQGQDLYRQTFPTAVEDGHS